MKEVARLPKLEKLRLVGTGTSDAGMGQLGALTELRELDLYDIPDVTDAGIRSLRSLKRLEKLYIRRCPGVKGSGPDDLKAALPFLKIEFIQ